MAHRSAGFRAQAVFGIGVGGEYPIASTSASERAEADADLQHRRGETVMLTFSMQGVPRRARSGHRFESVACIAGRGRASALQGCLVAHMGTLVNRLRPKKLA